MYKFSYNSKTKYIPQKSHLAPPQNRIITSKFKFSDTPKNPWRLRDEWKRMLYPEGLRKDILAGITVGCAALPLSLAIAEASNLSPSVGITSAVVGGTVASLFGGTTLAITGPSAAMGIILSDMVVKHGLHAVIGITLLCGVYQVITSFTKIPMLITKIPKPVITGFSFGVGSIIGISQIPKILGVKVPHDIIQDGNIPVLQYLADNINYVQPIPLSVAIATLSLFKLLPMINRKIPPIIGGISIMTGISYALGLDLSVIGEFSGLNMSIISMEMISNHEGILQPMILSSLAVYFLASMESLLSSSLADKLCTDKDIPKHNSKQEILGQGLANISSSLVGGMPVTSVIARTTLNISLDAKTRRSALIHCLTLVGLSTLFFPIISHIPTACISSTLLMIAYKLFSFNDVTSLYKENKLSLIPFGITFLTTIGTNLTLGVSSGLLSSYIIHKLFSRKPPSGNL